MSFLFVVGTLVLGVEMSKGMNLEEDALGKWERKYRNIPVSTVC